MPYQAPRGTHDVLPSVAHHWQQVESAFFETVSLRGYREIRTPAFEDTDLFIRSSGETSDVVSKQMYRFKDLSDRDLTLKPEGTAPAIRAFLEHKLGAQGGLTRLWYFTQIFRYERPQKGRQRQAHQVGVELIGSRSADSDFEVIELTMEFYRRLGITNLQLSLNSIGRAQTRAVYREKVLEHGAAYLADLDEEARAKAVKNPLRLLDSKDPKAIEAFADCPSILDVLEDESRAHFSRVQKLLSEFEIPFAIDPRIVRGLDYYNDTVFEVTSTDLGAQGSLCGGGRYDGLIKELGGPDTPAVGVAMGVERALIAMEAAGSLDDASNLGVFVINACPEARSQAISLCNALRSLDVSSQFDLDDRNLKGQMKAADRSEAQFAMILGEQELHDGTVTVKNLSDGTQSTQSIQEALESLTGCEIEIESL